MYVCVCVGRLLCALWFRLQGKLIKSQKVPTFHIGIWLSLSLSLSLQVGVCVCVCVGMPYGFHETLQALTAHRVRGDKKSARTVDLSLS